ncbi:MAG: hypothetical protein EKK46_07630 [Rhodocyclaceae bacterium]|nr:MAG: hypothetical protein EKK46_07630 [Rhodocyclaceae bacterium]
MSKLEDEIVKVLKLIPAKAESGNWLRSNERWTREIKNQICQIGRKRGWKSYANRCDKSTNKNEWLYDIVLWELDAKNKFARSMPLAVESEWSTDETRLGDFEKLIQSRAELRLWITHDKNKKSLKSHFNVCENIIHSFKASSPDDRYLFAGLSWDGNQFMFWRPFIGELI